MRLLLDAMSAIWAGLSPDRLPPTVRDALNDPSNEVFLSSVTVWELAIKVGLGKLELEPDVRSFVTSLRTTLVARDLSITRRHALGVADLPHHHRDPFDRLLVSQARLEGLVLVTNDPLIVRYDVPTLW
jgi:PIN domain nuclease of toxin-antitoxin system